MSSIKVSIIIPVFNSSMHLSNTIECILNQTYTDFEAIFVDNGSTDNSLDIINSYKDSRINLLHELRKGACYARNLGFSNSSGSIIQYLDSDDILSENYLYQKVYYLNKFGFDKIIFSRISSFQDSINSSFPLSLKLERNYSEGISMLLDMANFQQPSQISSWTISRDLHIKAGYWNVNLLRNQDGEMLMRLLLASSGTVFNTKANSYYRNTPNSISKNSSEKVLSSLFNSFESYEINMLAFENSVRVKRAIQQFYLTLLLIPSAIFIRNSVLQKVNSFSIRPILGGSFYVRTLSYILGVEIFSSLILNVKHFKSKYFD